MGGSDDGTRMGAGVEVADAAAERPEDGGCGVCTTCGEIGELSGTVCACCVLDMEPVLDVGGGG